MIGSSSLQDRSRYLNMHGEDGALLNRKDSIHPHQNEITSRLSAFAFDAISLTLFGMPSTHWQSLQEIYVNDAVDSVTWRQFIEKLKREWKLSTIPVTVLLGANASFLQIEAVGLGSFASIACFISMAFCIENFILCHILSRLFRDVHCSEMIPILDFVTRAETGWLGVRTIAVVCSLPAGFLMWRYETPGFPTFQGHRWLTLSLYSVIAFIVAVCQLYFTANVGGNGPKVVVIAVVSFMITVTFLVASVDHHRWTRLRSFRASLWERLTAFMSTVQEIGSRVRSKRSPNQNPISPV